METARAAGADIQARDVLTTAFGPERGFDAGKERVSFHRDGEGPGTRSVYGKSAAVLSVLAQVEQVAPTDSIGAPAR